MFFKERQNAHLHHKTSLKTHIGVQLICAHLFTVQVNLHKYHNLIIHIYFLYTPQTHFVAASSLPTGDGSYQFLATAPTFGTSVSGRLFFFAVWSNHNLVLQGGSRQAEESFQVWTI